MSEINLIPEEDIDDFITIVINAYPGMEISSQEDRERVKKRLITMQTTDETAHIYGLYRKGTLRGGMILYDFVMNFFSVKTLVGGVGLVAVDLPHKKEKVCKEMIAYFLNHYKEKGSCLTCLYSFRPDFYRNMGFGFGTKMHQYKVSPDRLPRTKKDHIQFIDEKDKHALRECYQRYADRTHGMMEMRESQLNRLFDKPEFTIVGYKKDDKILGYLIFTFKKGDTESFIVNDIEVRGLIYENKEVLLELLTFLHTQMDQIRYIIINTQDEYFYHLLPDPRNDSDRLIPPVYHESYVSGVGLMYRVIDTHKVFTILKDHNFGNQDCRLKLVVTDSFFKENEGEITVHFEKGISHLGKKGCEVEVRMDVSDFSSLIMGVVPFDRLYLYGLVHISNPEYVDVVTEIFRTKEKPVCTTDF